jgi:sensor domain CHASE-containing protein
MLSVLAALLALAGQDPGQWQDFGAAADGEKVALNLDSIETGAEGPEAVVRVSYPRAAANRAVNADYRSVFNCQARTATRLRMGERDAAGEIVSRDDEGQRVPPVQAPAGTPWGKVLDEVCAQAGG